MKLITGSSSEAISSILSGGQREPTLDSLIATANPRALLPGEYLQLLKFRAQIARHTNRGSMTGTMGEVLGLEVDAYFSLLSRVDI